MVASEQSPPLPRLESLLAQRGKLPVSSLWLDRRALAGGLEALLTEDVMARFVDAAERRHSFRFIAKHLRGRAVREADVYRALSACAPSPRMLANEPVGAGCVLYLEPVLPAERWPWHQEQRTAQVLERVATFHASGADHQLPRWNYEHELAISAEETLDALAQAARADALSMLRRGLPALKRLVLALPRLRQELFESSFGTTAIHGDLHSGNVLVRQRARSFEPVLIDWGRARSGSPLEDVSSWLQSLGFWEPETRRRHDTLFARYLVALGRSGRLSAETRESYWLAAASNALAGALAHHLWCAQHALPGERAGAAYRARDAVRVLLRADAVWS